MDICYIHIFMSFIYAEFSIIYVLLKEIRSKYKRAYALILTEKLIMHYAREV